MTTIPIVIWTDGKKANESSLRNAEEVSSKIYPS